MRKVTTMLVVIAAMLVLGSGIALAVTKVGSDGPDKLWGTNGHDTLIGKGGNDWLFSLKGKDVLFGGRGKDWVLGGNRKNSLPGEKSLTGGKGNDAVLGGKNADSVVGNTGNDVVDGGPGPDRVIADGGDDYVLDGERKNGKEDLLVGGEGNDVFDPYNDPAHKDVMECGDGFDRVLADSEDVVEDCEKVARGPKEARALDKQLSKKGGFYDKIDSGLGPSPLK